MLRLSHRRSRSINANVRSRELVVYLSQIVPSFRRNLDGAESVEIFQHIVTTDACFRKKACRGEVVHDELMHVR
jgi:hypothetical protein